MVRSPHGLLPEATRTDCLWGCVGVGRCGGQEEALIPILKAALDPAAARAPVVVIG